MPGARGAAAARRVARRRVAASDRGRCYDPPVLTVTVSIVALAVGAAAATFAHRHGAALRDRLRRLLTRGEPTLAKAPPDHGDEELVEPRIEPETVTALLENAKALADGEERRGDSLKQRAGWLRGFLGVMLTVLLMQAREFSRSDLGSVGKPLSAALVLVALVVLIDAARLALRTLSVVNLWHIGPDETTHYPSYRFIGKPPAEARGEMLQGWARQFAEERPANDIKAEQLQGAFRRLTSILGQIVVLRFSAGWESEAQLAAVEPGDRGGLVGEAGVDEDGVVAP
jgi:hypothetical protein